MGPLERSYPVVYFEALRVKIRDEGSIPPMPLRVCICSCAKC